jgi:hypothetical protein
MYMYDEPLMLTQPGSLVLLWKYQRIKMPFEEKWRVDRSIVFYYVIVYFFIGARAYPMPMGASTTLRP